MKLEVSTQDGMVRGRAAGEIAVFRGIRYAAAPFGPRRFLAPAPVTPWEGVRDAFDFGPTVPKPPRRPPMDQFLPEPVVPGEDCLNLNVWTPEPGGSGLPVMVWFHGGAFVNGSSAVPSYDGSRFARDGIVLVSVNYRLGVDGFLHFGDGDTNRGLLDQVAALRWVRANIAAFGGDPDNVTIFGESAGAMSVTALLAMPSADGLFRRAIAQSGGGHHALTADTAVRIAGHFAGHLGVPLSREAFAAVPLPRLLQAQEELMIQLRAAPDPERWGEAAANAMLFEPVLDGTVLPALPVERIRAGAGAGVDLLVGTNSQEHRFFLVPTGVIDLVDDATLAMIAGSYRLPVDRALAAYRAARPGMSAGEVLSDLMGDWFFRIPAIRLAEARAGGPAVTHLYEFTWGSPLYDGRLGACHALEIAFVFDTLDVRDDSTPLALHGDQPPQELADRMHQAWVSFAAKGDPGWPQYEPGRRQVMRFGTASAVADDPDGALRELWEGIR